MSEPFDPQRVGARLRQARRTANLTIQALADMAHVSPSYISDVERGMKNPSLPVMAALSQALGRSLDWLVFGNDRQSPLPDLRKWLRSPDVRLTYGDQVLDERDKERLVELIDAALAFRQQAGEGPARAQAQRVMGQPALAQPRAAEERGSYPAAASSRDEAELTRLVRSVVRAVMEELRKERGEA
ncbi:MAG TPA: helix-turn-helix transcriptional regulator [Bacillota bacterium]